MVMLVWLYMLCFPPFLVIYMLTKGIVENDGAYGHLGDK